MGIFEFELDETEPKIKTQNWPDGFPDFYDNLLWGCFFKDIVTILLAECGYEVYPFGYESFFPTLKRQLKDSLPSEVADRIRCTPDLLVRNQQEKRVELVEVKARSASKQRGIQIEQINLYSKFWPESILILIIPTGNYFYAQRVQKLEHKKEYSLEEDFCPLEEIFPLAKGLKENFRRKMVREVRTLCSNRNQANL